MNEKKLHLGCGYVYKPGYINIDKFDSSVADKIVDIANLPFKSNSIDLIEASQLIEHFDYVHCKYILSEWFRVLKPKGTLILETPDLEKSFKKFISSNLETQKTTLQWIYGIDSSGMQHKTGFTFNLLKDLLGEIGFDRISRENPIIHKYEPSMRMICKKPKNYLEKQLFACFRKKLKSRLDIDDSYVLIPLEKCLKKIFDSYQKFDKNYINEIISKTVICHPFVPLTFLEECVNFGLVKKSEIRDEMDLLNYLAKIEFHKKVFSLWIKNKKEFEVEEQFKNFVSRLEMLILDILHNQLEYKERLDYIIKLKPTKIDIFDFYLVLIEAKKLFNIAVKYFHQRKFSKALDLFMRSSRINPDNPLAYWNMARLGCILRLEKNQIIENYEKALKIMKNKKEISNELKHVRNGNSNLVQKEPVSEDYPKNLKFL